jgi:MOSC domain-containing protein
MRVTALSFTPVKGLRLQRVEQIELDRSGAVGNRRFFVVDDRDRMINSKVLGELQTVVAHDSGDRLELEFPGGRTVSGAVEPGETVEARFFSAVVQARPLDGPLSEALSKHLGRPVRIVLAPGSVDRGEVGAASLISRASLERLASQAGVTDVDPRRFRMLIEIDGVEAHAEDAWVERTVEVGEAAIRWRGHVGRCLITSRDPETGVIDLPTLDVLGDYRRDLKTTEPLPFGIYGSVEHPGAVRVGDELRLL